MAGIFKMKVQIELKHSVWFNSTNICWLAPMCLVLYHFPDTHFPSPSSLTKAVRNVK